jgi:hypothetical protein
MEKRVSSVLLLIIYGFSIQSNDIQQSIKILGAISFVTIGTLLTKNISYNCEPPPTTKYEIIKRFSLLGVMTPFSVPMMAAFHCLPAGLDLLLNNTISAQRKFSMVYFFPCEEIKNGDKPGRWKPKPLKNIQSRGKWYGCMSTFGSLAVLYNTAYILIPLYYECLKQVV